MSRPLPPPSRRSRLAAFLVTSGLLATALQAADDDTRWLTLPGKPGLPGNAKKVVLVSGDEEYRSEEAMPQLGKILSQRHGFNCVVLFAIDPDTGIIDPNNQTNIPGLQELDDADLMVLFTRFRNLPDEQMKHVIDYTMAGKPILGLRTATHAFNIEGDSAYKNYSFNSNNPQGGYGQAVLGDTWINHHGAHKSEATRGIVNKDSADHPVLRGVDDLFGPTDVYGIRNLPEDATVLVWGQVLAGMEPDSDPVVGEKNDPMQPVSWTMKYQLDGGQQGTAITSTFFSSKEMENEDVRRFCVNAAYWLTGLGDHITPDLDVAPVGTFTPSMYGFQNDAHWKEKALRPSDLAPAPEE